ncbi:FAD:protein FMN transferase [Verrucomicrobia bacterium]|nr:FAD:protein FMN transferase [Verrucomicrobiota bacterium]
MPQTVKLACEAMATRWEFILMGEDDQSLRSAGEEAIEEIQQLERQMSFYDPASDVSRINRSASVQPVRVEPQLFSLLERCIQLSTLTDGAFDMTVAPLMQLWGFVKRSLSIPNDDQLREALIRVGSQYVELNPDDYTIQFNRPGMLLDLGSVGKGYALDRVLEILREYEIKSALIHGGTSSIATIGTPLDGSEWRIGLEHPENYLNTDPSKDQQYLGYVVLEDESLGVSAVWGKAFQTEDRTYGHVIDPRTGWPTTGAVYSAVRGRSNTDLDVLATAALVMGDAFSSLKSVGADGSLIYYSGADGLQCVERKFPIVR